MNREPNQGRARALTVAVRPEIHLAARMLSEHSRRAAPISVEAHLRLWLSEVVEGAVIERFEEAYGQRLGDVLGKIQRGPAAGNARRIREQLELQSPAFCRRIGRALAGRIEP